MQRVSTTSELTLLLLFKHFDMALIYRITLALTVLTALAKAQRPPVAGLSPIGYPVVKPEIIENRFGEDEPAPIEARGDRYLINRLSALPIDNQPFWFINWKAYEALRNKPQTYPQRQNTFTK